MNGTLLEEPDKPVLDTACFDTRLFIAAPDVCERHELVVHAPADLVFEVAEQFDMMSLPAVRAIFRMRERLMGAARTALPRRQAFLANAGAMGWRLLVHRPGREHVMGAAAQPWLANVEFEPVPPERFESYCQPDRVKIVWSVETEPIGPALTRLGTETRVVATDETARRKFLHYWRKTRIGIVMIRLLLLPAIRREAEWRWRESLRPLDLDRPFSGRGRRTARGRLVPPPPP